MAKKVHCFVCGREWISGRNKKSLRTALRQGGWGHTEIKGKTICITCTRCRSCGGGVIRPYRVSTGDKGLCLKCLRTKDKYFKNKTRSGGIVHVFVDEFKKPLKSLIKLSRKDFKLRNAAILKKVSDDTIIEIGFFQDPKGQVFMIAQISKAKTFDRKGKIKPRVFDRRKQVAFWPTGEKDFAVFKRREDYFNRFVDMVRWLGYVVTLKKNNWGKQTYIGSDWQKTGREWAEQVKRDEIERAVQDAIEEKFEEVEEKYNKIAERRAWVEEEVPTQGAEI